MTQKLISSGQESVVEDDLGTKLGLLAHEIINETMNFRSAQISRNQVTPIPSTNSSSTNNPSNGATITNQIKSWIISPDTFLRASDHHVFINDVMSFNIDVGVMINDYHHHLRGEGGGVFIRAPKFPLPSLNRERYHVPWYIRKPNFIPTVDGATREVGVKHGPPVQMHANQSW